MMQLSSVILHLAPSVITAGAIVSVGYWVNTTVRRKSQRDAILITYLQELQRSIHEHIDGATEATNFSQCMHSLRRLGDDIHHFRNLPIHEGEARTRVENKTARLTDLVVELKGYLTETLEPADRDERERARRTGSQLKSSFLEIIFELCDSKNFR